MTSDPIGSEATRFGEVAIRLGFLASDEVNEALAVQVRQKLLTCLRWESPAVTFHPGIERIEGVVRFPCELDEVVFQAVTLLYEPRRIARILAPFLDERVELNATADETAERFFPMSRCERAFLEHLEGGVLVRAAIHATPLDPSRAARILACLILLEAATVVGVEDAPSRTDQPTVRPPQPLEPVPPVARGRRLAAELALRAGRGHLNLRAFERALGEFRRATELDPEVAEYRVYVDWAELMLATDPRTHRRKRAAVVRSATQQLRTDPNFGFGLYVIGALRMDAGQHEKAASALELSLKLDPDNHDADRRLGKLRSGAPAVEARTAS
jgi:tetratricopeptide (TPR) repeat protein